MVVLQLHAVCVSMPTAPLYGEYLKIQCGGGGVFSSQQHGYVQVSHVYSVSHNIIYNKAILPDVSVLDAYMLDVASLDVAARCFLFRWIDPGSILGRSSTETS